MGAWIGVGGVGLEPVSLRGVEAPQERLGPLGPDRSDPTVGPCTARAARDSDIEPEDMIIMPVTAGGGPPGASRDSTEDSD